MTNIYKIDSSKNEDLGTQLEMIQSNVCNEQMTFKIMKNLLLNQKMTHFQVIDEFRDKEDLTMKSVSQLYSFLIHIGYKMKGFGILELILSIKQLKEDYIFIYKDEPRSKNNKDTILKIYFKKRINNIFN